VDFDAGLFPESRGLCKLTTSLPGSSLPPMPLNLPKCGSSGRTVAVYDQHSAPASSERT